MDRGGDKKEKKREDTGGRHSLSLSFSSSPSSSFSSSSDKSLTTSDQVSEEPIAAAIDNMEEVSKVFNKYDANGDGKISSDEFRSSLRALGYNLSDEELRNAMAEMDTDGDGFVDLAEFAEFHRGPQAAGPDCELRRAFAVYDKDRNGVISARELHAVMKQLGEKVSVKDCSRMIKTVDLDGDGCVNFKEFAMMMSSNSNSNPASAKKTAGASRR